MRILVISAEAMIGDEYRNLPLSRELLSRGHEVIHTGPSGAMSNQGFTGSTYPPETETISEFKSANTRLFNSRDDLLDIVDWSNLIILGIGKGYKEVAEYANKTSKPVILMRDVGADHMWSIHCELAAVRGKFEIEHTKKLTALDTDRIKITGCVQFDAAEPTTQRPDRDTFCKKYGLDPNKKLVLIASSHPGTHTETTKNIFMDACKIVNETKGFQALIQPHPKEYAGIKMWLYENKSIPTWQQNAPGIPALDAGDKFDAFHYCELIIATRFSALSKETALFNRPLIYLQSIERYAELLETSSEIIKNYLPERLNQTTSRKQWLPLGTETPNLGRIPGASKSRGWNGPHDSWSKCYGESQPDFIGMDCFVSELKDVLISGAYEFNNMDVYDTFINEYCYSNDGKAYKRVADLVEYASSNQEISKMLADQTNILKITPILIKLIRKASRLLP